MELVKKKRYLIILIIAILVIISLGTYAWLSYRTNDTAMVLTVGNINDVKITMSPYQIDAKISPNLTYTAQPYTTIEVVNNSSSPRNIKLFYIINAIDSELATSNLKYTIEKKAVGTSSYTNITPDGNFAGASKGDTIDVITEAVPTGTTMYKVYVWLYSASSAQNNVPGKKFNAELNATIGENQYQVNLDANNGTVSPEFIVVNAGGTYQNLPTPTRSSYVFMGWNGKNLFNVDDVYTDCYINKSNGSMTPYTNNSTPWNCSDYIEIVGGQTYTFNPNSAPGSTNTSHSLYDIDKNFIQSFDSGLATIATPSNAKYIRVSYRRSNSIDIQLEEGSAATAYEPYYITNGTNVVQNQNHTLTAVWQKNNS